MRQVSDDISRTQPANMQNAPESGSAESWVSGSDGAWGHAANWSGDTVPDADTAVNISTAGTYTVRIDAAATAQSVTVDDPTASIDDVSTLTLAGTLALDAGTFLLGKGASILGGTLSAGADAAYQWEGGTLTGDTYQGALLIGHRQKLTLAGGTTLTAAGGNGGGVIEFKSHSVLDIYGPLTGEKTIGLRGGDSVLTLFDTQVLDHATVRIGNDIAAASLINASSARGSSTLTFGSHLLLEQVGRYATVTGNSAVINQGTITAADLRGTLAINGGTAGFTNQGTIAISNGDSVTVLGAFANTGTISIGGSLSTLDLVGTETTAGLGAIGVDGGTLELGGTLSNAGATLSIGTGTALGDVLLHGIIGGGTVVDSGGALVPDDGVLSDVTYQGGLTVGGYAMLSLDGNTTLTGIGGIGAGSVNLSGYYATLYAQGPVTGLGTVTINGFGDYVFLDQQLDQQDALALTVGGGGDLMYYAYGPTLTLGSQVRITDGGGGARAAFSATNIISQGTITASASGGDLCTFVFGVFGGNFTNDGAIDVSNGDNVSLSFGTLTNDGTISVRGAGSALQLAGTLTTADLANVTNSGGLLQLSTTLGNTGATLAIGSGTALGHVQLDGSFTGGTIVSNDSTLLLDGTLANLTLVSAGIIDVGNRYDYAPGNAPVDLALSGGTTLTNGAGGGVTVTLVPNNTGVFVKLTVDQNVTGLAVVNDTGVSTALDLQAGVTLDNATVNLGNANQYEPSYIYAENATFGSQLGLNQTGVGAIIAVTAGDHLVNRGTITASVAAGTLALASGGAFLNQGDFQVSDGDMLMVSNTLTNTGVFSLGGSGTTMELAGGTFQSSSTLTLASGTSLVGDTAGGTATVAAAVIDGSVIEAASGTLLIDGAITGGGLLQVDAGATLAIDGSATASGTASFNGAAGVLQLDSASSFASTINDFGSSDVINLGTLVATAAKLSGGYLNVTLSSGGSLTFTMTGTPAGEKITISPDGHSLTGKVTSADQVQAGAAILAEAFGTHAPLAAHLVWTNDMPTFENIGGPVSHDVAWGSWIAPGQAHGWEAGISGAWLGAHSSL